MVDLPNRWPIRGSIGGPHASRQPFPGERNFFRVNPNVAGMATEDDSVILNPYSRLTPQEQEAVYRNELARILMRRPEFSPNFDLTNEQRNVLSTGFYATAPEKDRMATIAARIYSGDPSGGAPTPEQQQFVNALRLYLGVRSAPFTFSGSER